MGLRLKQSFFILVLLLSSPGKANADEVKPHANSALASSFLIAQATPGEDIFAPYLEEIEENLPPGWSLRLPSQELLQRAIATAGEEYFVEISPATTTSSFTLSFFTCSEKTDACLAGSFAVARQDSTIAQIALEEHQQTIAPLALTKGIEGYFREGSMQTPPSPFSSIVWQQDGYFYQIQFLADKREFLVYMAGEMATREPIVGTGDGVIVQNPEPNPNRFLQPQPTLETIPKTELPLQLELDPPTTTPQPSLPESFKVEKIRVIGSTVFTKSDLGEITKNYEGREVTSEELRELKEKISQRYLNDEAGYINSKAFIPDQNLDDGVVEIQIIEGRLVDIDVKGTERLDDSYIRDRLSLDPEKPLSIRELENKLRLLRLDPLLENVEASLQATGEAGESELIVRVTEAPVWNVSLGVDNYSPPSVGSERLGVSVSNQNLTGRGDKLSATYFRTISGGADVFDLSYSIPLNSNNGTLQLRVAPNRNEVTDSQFEALGIRGQTERYEVSFRQPLFRSPSEEFAVSLGFSYQEGQTFIFNQIPTPFGIGPDDNGFSRTSVFRLGQDYIHRSPEGTWYLQSQFNFGTGLFDATSNEGSIPDGQFFSWLGQVQRVQRLGERHLLLVQGQFQFTPDSLLASEQFVIGGGQSVRGYRQNARTGDVGFRLSVEDRITLWEETWGTVQLVPFLDLGLIANAGDNPNQLPRETFLAGTGVGLIWDKFMAIEGLRLRLDYAVPLVDVEDRGRNIQDEGFYFDLRYVVTFD